MAVLIAATTAASTSAAFTMSGGGKLMASGLQGSETVTLTELYPDSVYRAASDASGMGIVLTAARPVQLVEGYGSYQVTKTATVANAAVSYES